MMAKVKQEKQKKKISGNFSQTSRLCMQPAFPWFSLVFPSLRIILSFFFLLVVHPIKITVGKSHQSLNTQTRREIKTKSYLLSRDEFVPRRPCAHFSTLLFSGSIKIFSSQQNQSLPTHTHSLHAIVQQIWTHLNNIQKKIISLMVFIRIPASCFHPTHFWVNWICLQTKPCGLEWKINPKYKDNKTRTKTFQLLAVGI